MRRPDESQLPSGSSCSPARASRPTRGSPTSGARRGSGPATRRPRRPPTSNNYLADPTVRRAAWLNRLDTPVWTAEPNRGHGCIVELERARHAARDRHPERRRAAPGGRERSRAVIEVHGTVRWTRCWECGDRRPMRETLDRVRAGEADPPCLVCGGILKSDTISFGQSLVPEVIERAMRVSGECDLMLAIGSTLSVYPVANCVPTAKRNGAVGGDRQRPADRDGPSRRPSVDRSDRRHPAGARRAADRSASTVRIDVPITRRPAVRSWRREDRSARVNGARGLRSRFDLGRLISPASAARGRRGMSELAQVVAA